MESQVGTLIFIKMKRIIFFVLLLTPSVLFAQLDRDGKTELPSTRIKQTDRGTHTILFSGSTLTPFGIKYQYCKNFGGYVSFKTDADLIDYDFIISAGLSKSTGKRSNLWFGGGIDLGYTEDWDGYNYITVKEGGGLEIEAGWMVKGETGFSFDIGVGSSFNWFEYYGDNWEYYDEEYLGRFFLILGLGYSF
jgi:hypothetical protein